MFQCQPCCSLVIQHNIGHAFHALMPCHRHRRQRQLFHDGRVCRNEAFHPARQEHLRIGLKQLRIMPVDHCQEEIVILSQVFFNAANDHRAVSIANLFRDHANRIRSLQSQSARKKIRSVVQFLRRRNGLQRNLVGAACARFLPRQGCHLQLPRLPCILGIWTRICPTSRLPPALLARYSLTCHSSPTSVPPHTTCREIDGSPFWLCHCRHVPS